MLGCLVADEFSLVYINSLQEALYIPFLGYCLLPSVFLFRAVFPAHFNFIPFISFLTALRAHFEFIITISRTPIEGIFAAPAIFEPGG